ncbi:NYN domain-containing protein [Microcoleus sp. B4-C5]|uniref:NYN domain-containing protein n=1 Tax=unclassified Microcoleus TaxID=2642155 RepID=UPI002FD6F967
MTNHHSIIGKQTKQSQALVSIYVDLQNANSIKHLGSLLLEFAKFQGSLIDAKVYYNSLCPDQVSAKDKLQNVGFKCIDVPCPLKNSADNQLIADCLEDIDSNQSPDTVILLSGDGDFIKLVRNLQKLDKKVIVFAEQGQIKQRLKELVGSDFHFLDELPSLVASKTQQQIQNIQCQLTYSEAVEYLMEAIKTALSKGKGTGLGFINNLMLQLFPKYQGVTFVYQHQGKTFSRFSELVKAAVKDGKIRLQDQQLFVIEADRLSA